MAEAGDFLTILLTDDLFKDNNKRIVDEALTFFFAGSQTSGVATSNLLISLLKHPEYQKKLLRELEEQIVHPHLQQLAREGKLNEKSGERIPARSINLLDLITYENNSELSLYGDCFNEALRM